MELIRNIRTDATPFEMEGEVWFPLFDRWILLMVEEGGSLQYARVCAKALGALTAANLDQMCRATIRCGNDFLNAIGEEPMSFANPAEVLRLLSPVSMIVPVAEEGAPPVVHLEIKAEWEDEHAIEWIVRGGEVVYVGSFHLEDPWADYSVKEKWNYA